MGSTVLMTTNVGYKYEGVLIGYNSSELTITLKNVRFMGTDGQVIESNTENDAVKKLPAIGTSFKVVTFWITNVRKINTIEEAKVNSLIGDAAVKETTGIEENTLPIKPPVGVFKFSILFLPFTICDCLTNYRSQIETAQQ